MKKLLLTLLCAVTALGGFAVDRTLDFITDNYSQQVSGYTISWTTKSSQGDEYSLVNFNNQNSTWTVLRCGRKNNASVASITSPKFDEAISEVTVTLEAVNTSKATVTLLTSSDNSTWTEVGTFTNAKGDQSVKVTNPAAGLYYQIKFDCASHSSNGFEQVSKVVYTEKKDVNPNQLSFEYSGYSVNVDELKAIAVNNPGNVTVQYTTSDESVAMVDEKTGEVLGVAVGTATIKATQTDDETNSASYELTVVDPNAPGTENNPYTVAQAIAACSSNPSGVYVKGIVISSNAWSTQYNNVDYYIADDAGTAEDKALKVFRGIWDDGVTNKPADNTPEVGATVIVKGDLLLYGNNKTPEINSGNTIVSYTAPTIVKVLGDIVVTLPDGSNTVEEGEYNIKLGQSITASAANAESIMISALHEDNTDYNVEGGTWTPEKEGTHLVTVTATLGDAVKEHSFSLTVNPKPLNYTDNLTTVSFGLNGTSYALKSYTSENTGVTYYAKANVNNGLQINTPASTSGKNSGLVSTDNPNSLIIEKIEVKFYNEATAASKLIVSVSNTPNSYDNGTDTKTAKVTLATDAVNGSDYIESSNVDGIYTYTPKGNYTYMGLTSTGPVQLTDINVYYKAPALSIKGEDDSEISGDELNITGNEGWYQVTVEAPKDYTIFYQVNSPHFKINGVEVETEQANKVAAKASTAYTDSKLQSLTLGLSSEGTFSLYAQNSKGFKTETKTYTVVGNASGVEDIVADTDADVAPVYYNMQGVRVSNPAAGGLYIKVQGNKASKVLVR